ncbi:MAG: hypothetical protein II968_01675 [Selenomonadaceae bacterium]|nr:hypothetical protein [Selenomonadaceae bacterium]
MNQKGFATIFGLCMILVIALVVKGIEESAMNHAYEATDIQAEVELQNAADSGIYAAVKIALADPEGTLPKNPGFPNRRKAYQHKFDDLTIKSESLGTITVETWGERTTFKPYKVNHSTKKAKEDKSRPIKDVEAYVFFSRASADSNRMSGKIYRRAYAYVLADGDATIYFMGLPTTDDYKLE